MSGQAEFTPHSVAIQTMLRSLTYLLTENGGGGIHAVRDPKQAFEYAGYMPPAVVVMFAGTQLRSADTKVQGGALYQEELLFDLTTVNASFDLEGDGSATDVVPGDPGALVMISDIRNALYGKTFQAPDVWTVETPMRTSKIFPRNPPVTILGASVPDANRIYYRLLLRTTSVINA